MKEENGIDTTLLKMLANYMECEDQKIHKEINEYLKNEDIFVTFDKIEYDRGNVYFEFSYDHNNDDKHKCQDEYPKLMKLGFWSALIIRNGAFGDWPKNKTIFYFVHGDGRIEEMIEE